MYFASLTLSHESILVYTILQCSCPSVLNSHEFSMFILHISATLLRLWQVPVCWMSTYCSVLIHCNSFIMFFGCLYPCSLHWTSSVCDTTCLFVPCLKLYLPFIWWLVCHCYDRFSSPVGRQNRDGSEVGGILTTAHRGFSGCTHRCAGKPKRRDQDRASPRRRGRARSGTAEE